MLGMGRMYSSLESVIHLLHPACQDEALKILRDHHVERVEYEHALFACPECCTLEEHFFHQNEYDHGKLLRSVFQCSGCGQDLVPAKNDIERYRCPACGRRRLVQELEFLWD